MTTQPTPEQIDAAKAYTRDEETDGHLLALRKYDMAENTTVNAARILLAALESAEAQLKGAMQEGGYEYFVGQLRNAQRQEHNAIYVAEQLKKKVEKLEALDELTTNQAREYLERAEAAEDKLEAAEADRERLDWLQLYLSDFTKNIGGPTSGGPGWEFGYNAGAGYVVDGYGETLRDAIDAARKAQP